MTEDRSLQSQILHVHLVSYWSLCITHISSDNGVSIPNLLCTAAFIRATSLAVGVNEDKEEEVLVSVSWLLNDLVTCKAFLGTNVF